MTQIYLEKTEFFFFFFCFFFFFFFGGGGSSQFFETVIHFISGRFSEREKERENIDERREKKMSKQPPALSASAICPCPTIIQSN